MRQFHKLPRAKFASIYKKVTSLFLVLFFTLLNIFPYPFSLQASSTVDRLSQTSMTASEIVLPEELGLIQEKYQAAGCRPQAAKKSMELEACSGKQVIFIQDAHSNYDAQKSIQKIIGYFQKQYGVETIALEGGEGKLDPWLLRTYPDRKIVEKILDDHLMKGELSGATLAAVLNEKEGNYYGVENFTLYEDGIEAYRKASSQSTVLRKQIAEIEMTLNKNKEKFYSRELKQLNHQLAAFERQEIDLSKLLLFLSSIRKPANFPLLTALVKELRFNPETDYPKIKNKIKRLSQEIKPKLDQKQEIILFNEKSQSFYTSQLDPKAFSHFLLYLAQSKGLSLDDYEDLKRFSRNSSWLTEMQSAELFAQLRAYTAHVKETYLTDSRLQMLDELDNRLHRLKRLASLEMSRSEWYQLQSEKDKMTPWVFEAFLSSINSPGVIEGNLKVEAHRSKNRKSFAMEEHLRFYEIAIQREAALLKNLMKYSVQSTAYSEGYQSRRSTQNAVRSTIFVAGGFHTQGMTALFKKQGISYVVISPRITHLPDEAFYQQIMMGDFKWRSYLTEVNGRANLYDAFHWSFMDKLGQIPSGDQLGGTLKLWRDEMIRFLSNNGQISKAKDYTRFIDSLAAQKLSPEEKTNLEHLWRTRVEEFLSRFKAMVEIGSFSEKNFSELFKPTSLTPTVLSINPLIPRSEVRVRSREDQYSPFYERMPLNELQQELKGLDSATLGRLENLIREDIYLRNSKNSDAASDTMDKKFLKFFRAKPFSDYLKIEITANPKRVLEQIETMTDRRSKKRSELRSSGNEAKNFLPFQSRSAIEEKINAAWEIFGNKYADSERQSFFSRFIDSLPGAHLRASTLTVNRLVDQVERAYELYARHQSSPSRNGFVSLFNPAESNHTELYAVAVDREGLQRDILSVVASVGGNVQEDYSMYFPNPTSPNERTAIIIFEITRHGQVFPEASFSLLKRNIAEQLKTETVITGYARLPKIAQGHVALLMNYSGGITDVAYDIFREQRDNPSFFQDPNNISNEIKSDLGEFNRALSDILSQIENMPRIFSSIKGTSKHQQESVDELRKLVRAVQIEVNEEYLKPIPANSNGKYAYKKSSFSRFLELLEERSAGDLLKSGILEEFKKRLRDRFHKRYAIISAGDSEKKQQKDIDDEIERFSEGVEKELNGLQKKGSSKANQRLTGLLGVIATSPSSLASKIKDEIQKNGISAAEAILRVIPAALKILKSSELSKDQDNAADIEKFFVRVFLYLKGDKNIGAKMLTHHDTQGDIVLFARNLDPFELINMLDLYPSIRAIVSDEGSTGAHWAQLAADSYGLPVLIISPDSNFDLLDDHLLGQYAIVDGISKKIILNPNSITRSRYEELSRGIASRYEEATRNSTETAETQTNRVFRVLANGDDADLNHAVASYEGAEGIGLIRTEYLMREQAIKNYVENQRIQKDIVQRYRKEVLNFLVNYFLEKARQIAVYAEGVSGLSEIPITIRGLDMEEDKEQRSDSDGVVNPNHKYGPDYYYDKLGKRLVDIVLESILISQGLGIETNNRVLFPMFRSMESLNRILGKTPKNTLGHLSRWDQKMLNAQTEKDVDHMNRLLDSARTRVLRMEKWGDRSIAQERIHNIKRGFMIETIEGVEVLPYILERSQFISVGTTDLTISSHRDKGISRDNVEDAAYFDQPSQSFLFNVKKILDQVSKYNEGLMAEGKSPISVSFCGALAGLETFALFLAKETPSNVPIELSVTPEHIPSLKQFIRRITTPDLDLLTHWDQKDFSFQASITDKIEEIKNRRIDSKVKKLENAYKKKNTDPQDLNKILTPTNPDQKKFIIASSQGWHFTTSTLMSKTVTELGVEQATVITNQNMRLDLKNVMSLLAIGESGMQNNAVLIELKDPDTEKIQKAFEQIQQLKEDDGEIMLKIAESDTGGRSELRAQGDEVERALVQQTPYITHADRYNFIIFSLQNHLSRWLGEVYKDLRHQTDKELLAADFGPGYPPYAFRNLARSLNNYLEKEGITSRFVGVDPNLIDAFDRDPMGEEEFYIRNNQVVTMLEGINGTPRVPASLRINPSSSTYTKQPYKNFESASNPNLSFARNSIPEFLESQKPLVSILSNVLLHYSTDEKEGILKELEAGLPEGGILLVAEAGIGASDSDASIVIYKKDKGKLKAFEIILALDEKREFQHLQHLDGDEIIKADINTSLRQGSLRDGLTNSGYRFELDESQKGKKHINYLRFFPLREQGSLNSVSHFIPEGRSELRTDLSWDEHRQASEERLEQIYTLTMEQLKVLNEDSALKGEFDDILNFEQKTTLHTLVKIYWDYVQDKESYKAMSPVVLINENPDGLWTGDFYPNILMPFTGMVELFTFRQTTQTEAWRKEQIKKIRDRGRRATAIHHLQKIILQNDSVINQQIQDVFESISRSEVRLEDIEQDIEIERIPKNFEYFQNRINEIWALQGYEKLKSLIIKYADVPGMRDFIVRLDPMLLQKNVAQWNEIVGELYTAEYLENHIKGAQVIALGLYVGRREIDIFLAVDPEKAKDNQPIALEAGLYLVEVKEDDHVYMDQQIQLILNDQIKGQAVNAESLNKMGLPLKGLILAMGGANVQANEKYPLGKLSTENIRDFVNHQGLDFYSIVLPAYNVQNLLFEGLVEKPAGDQISALPFQKTRTIDMVKIIGEYFYGKDFEKGFFEAVDSRVQNHLEELKKLQRMEEKRLAEVKTKMIEKKRRQKLKMISMEKALNEVDGWSESFSNAGIRDENLEIKLKWYFLQNKPLEVLRRDLQEAWWETRPIVLPYWIRAFTDRVPGFDRWLTERMARPQHAYQWLTQLWEQIHGAETKEEKESQASTKSALPPQRERLTLPIAQREAEGWIESFTRAGVILSTDPNTIQSAKEVVVWYFSQDQKRGVLRQELQTLFNDKKVGPKKTLEWLFDQKRQKEEVGQFNAYLEKLARETVYRIYAEQSPDGALYGEIASIFRGTNRSELRDRLIRFEDSVWRQFDLVLAENPQFLIRITQEETSGFVDISQELAGFIESHSRLILEQIHQNRADLKNQPAPELEGSLSTAVDLKVLPNQNSELESVIQSLVHSKASAVVAYDAANPQMVQRKGELQKMLGKNSNRLFFERKIDDAVEVSVLARALKVKGGESQDFMGLMYKNEAHVSKDLKERAALIFAVNPEALKHLKTILPLLQLLAVAPETLRHQYMDELGLVTNAQTGLTAITTRVLENIIRLAEAARSVAQAA